MMIVGKNEPVIGGHQVWMDRSDGWRQFIKTTSAAEADMLLSALKDAYQQGATAKAAEIRRALQLP